MKKQLLLISFLISMSSYAQVIATEDFESLTVGNVGTDITGTTAGQGGWYTYNSAGGTNNNVTNYQIIDQSGNKKFQLTGSDAATGSKYMWKSGFATAWTNRVAGNNIVEVEVDFYTGSATTSKNTVRVVLYDNNTTATKVIAGLYYIPETRAFHGLAYYNNAGTLNTYFFKLGAANTDLILNANTWYRLGFSWNSDTGEVKWKGASANAYVMGAGVGLVPDEVDLMATAGTSNTAASVTMFDNLIVRASATDTLLGINENTLVTEFNIYPNPSKDIITISSDDHAYTAIQLSDINGRLISSTEFESTNQKSIDISNLTNGIYLMKIISNKGTFTQKIIKE
jgi:hypothetical protein